MIRLIRLLLNINKKLYIIVNNKTCDKGKIVRSCVTLGQLNPYYNKVIVVRGGNEYNDLLNYYKNFLGYNAPGENEKFKFKGEHIDAGYTQVSKQTSLAFAITKKNNEKINLPLY